MPNTGSLIGCTNGCKMKMILALIAVFLCIGMKVERIDCRVMLVMAIAISLIVFVTYLNF